MANRKSSEELEREIEARRARIENRVDDISARLSPGQLLDEALRYARSGPGADFTRNLGRSVVDNPLPVTLAAASLGWLAIQSNLPRHNEDDAHNGYDPYDPLDEEDDYPLAVITGTSVRRVSSTDHEGNRYSEFADGAGKKFKALSDETGYRAGHFADETGRIFRGFIDETGHRVSDFRDETGNRFHQASGWAAHNWRKAGKGLSKLGRNVRHGTGQIGDQAHRAGHGLRRQSEHAVHTADDFLHHQPLVSGALAFAIGALFGGVLPHTRQEDELFGDASDSLKREATDEAEHLYERGRDHAGHLHDDVKQATGDLYDKAKASAQGGAGTDQAKSPSTSG